MGGASRCNSEWDLRNPSARYAIFPLLLIVTNFILARLSAPCHDGRRPELRGEDPEVRSFVPAGGAVRLCDDDAVVIIDAGKPREVSI